MSQEYICLIPRNLNKPDTLINTKYLQLNLKQVMYIGAGIGGAYLAFQTGWPIVAKIGVMTASAGFGLLTSLVKYKDSSVDELIVDGAIYTQRKTIYKQMQKGSELIVNINSKKEETTATNIKPTSFAVSRT